MELILGQCNPGSRSAILAGDNRPITDHGRKLGDAALQGELDSHRARFESTGWTLEWPLLSRAANAAADRLANAAREGTRPASHARRGGAPPVP